MDSKYTYIVNPLTGRKVQITGPTGRKVLKFYLKQQGSGCVLKGKRCKWKDGKPNSKDCYCINSAKKRDRCKKKHNDKIRPHHQSIANTGKNCEESATPVPVPVPAPAPTSVPVPVPAGWLQPTNQPTKQTNKQTG